jgi:hypothetical protein
VAAAGFSFVPGCYVGARVIGMKMALLFYRCPCCPRGFQSSVSLARDKEFGHSC